MMMKAPGKRIWLSTFIHTFLVVLFLTACQSNADPTKAPDFTLLDLHGNTVNLSDYSGKVVLVNFFATHCPPCRMEMADFIKLQNEFGPQGFSVLAISVDQDGEQVLPGFVQQMGLNFPVLLATTKVVEDYGNVYALPQSFLIDRQQHLLRKFVGAISEDEVVPLIVKALGPKDAKSHE